MAPRTANLFNFFFFCSVALVLGWLSSWHFPSLHGFAPNLVLAVLISVLFLNFDAAAALLVFFLGFLTLSWQPRFGPESIALIIVAVFLIFSRHYLNFSNFLNLIFITLAATFIFYLLHAFKFLFAFPHLVLFEGTINIVSVAVLIGIAHLLDLLLEN